MTDPAAAVELTRQDIERRAHEVLEHHGLVAVPVDPVKLAGALRIRVNNAVFADVRISGMVAQRGGGTTILINQRDHPYRKRFTIAHELGHHFLHLVDDGEYVDTEVDLFRGDEEGPRRAERDANRFAAALLMPADLLASEVEQNPGITLEELATRFRVSESAMGIRLSSLGLEITAVQPDGRPVVAS